MEITIPFRSQNGEKKARLFDIVIVDEREVFLEFKSKGNCERIPLKETVESIVKQVEQIQLEKQYNN